MSLINIKNYKNIIYIKPVLDTIYLCILGLYIMRKLFNITMFTIDWPVWYYEYLRIAMILFLIVKIVVYDSKNMKAFIFDLLYLVVFYFVYKGTGYKFLLELGFFVLAAKDISYKKIMRLHFCVVASIMAITILGALTGCIEDLVFVRNDMFKHAFGIAYTTDFAAQLLFLVITYLSCKEKVPSLSLNILMLYLAYILYRYSGARNSSGCIIFLVLGGLYIKYSDKEILSTKTKSSWRKLKLKMFQIVDSCLVMAVPISALVALLFTIYYSPDNVIMSRVNQFSSGRLVLGKNAIDQYGFSLWGSPFDMVGIGANYVTRTDYNFVDSSYVMICVRYGVVLFLLMILGFLWLTIKAKKAGQRYMLVLLAVMALQSIMEHHLLDVFCNSLVLLIFTNMNNSGQPEHSVIDIRKNRSRFKYGIVIIVVFVIYFNHSRILAYGRTIITLLSLNESGRNIYFILAMLVGGIVCILTGVLLWRLYLVIVERKNKKFLFIYSIGSVSCFILFISGIFACNSIMAREAIKYEQRIQAGKMVLEQLNQVEDYKLYIDDIPYLYMKDKKNSKNIIPGTPYRRDIKKAVIITKSSNEMVNLLNSGYVCGQISDTEYLYTNDVTIVNIIREMGIEMDNYYGAKKSVDLMQMAEWNRLAVDDKGSPIIAGSKKSLIHGPWMTLYAGVFKVNYDLELLETEISDGEVATLKLTSYNGRNTISEVTVNKADFDENGHFIVSLDIYIPDSVGVEFMLVANSNTKLKLNELTYEKIRKR